jgi:DedD protein
LNQQVKTRLVGAVVLVSLAVIFIPMLLDGGNRERSPLEERFVPERSDLDFKPLEIPLQPPKPAEQARLIDRPVEVAPEPETATEAPPPVVEAKPATEPKATPPPAEPKASPPAAESSDGVLAWVVQVGSFSQQDNAMKLRDRLRSEGFTAFVDRASSAGKTIWRVRVGPELKRENAEKQRERLQQQMKLEGIVLGHEV